MRAITILLAIASVGVHADDEVDCNGMRTKALRQWLAARGLKCDGCAEKAECASGHRTRIFARPKQPETECASKPHDVRVRV